MNPIPDLSPDPNVNATLAVLKIGPERYRAPECLFHPEQMGSECMGVNDCLVKGIMRTDMDMRRTLFGQVVLSGGSTLFPGFGDRLLNEVFTFLQLQYLFCYIYFVVWCCYQY